MMDEWQTWVSATDALTRSVYAVMKRTLRTQRGPFTLVDVALVLHGLGITVDGGSSISLRGRPNSVLVHDASATLVAIVEGIASDPDFVMDVCKASRYPPAFKRNSLPSGNRITGTDYDTPHWIPVTIALSRSGGAR